MTAGVQSLLMEAAEFRLLALLFECPRAGWLEQVSKLGQAAADPLLRAAARHAPEEASEGLYHSIFGPGGPAAPREVSYLRTVQLGYLLSELSAYYDAFRYAPATQEAPDHIAVELGFFGFLRMKQAFALVCGEQAAHDTAADAAARFRDEHLSVIAQPLAAALAESGVSYLAVAAKAALEKIGPPRAAAVLPCLAAEETKFDCGVCS